MKNIYIFLDDTRVPMEAIRYVGTLSEDFIPAGEKYQVVRDVSEFKILVDQVLARGDRIDAITFDHDLGLDAHYQEKPNGTNAAKYILELIMGGKMNYVPRGNAHSANPIGAKNIFGIIDDWQKVLR